MTLFPLAVRSPSTRPHQRRSPPPVAAPRWRARSLTRRRATPFLAARLLGVLVAAVVSSLVIAQSVAPADDAWLSVPGKLVRVTDDAVVFQAFGSEVSYLLGLGWTTGWTLPAPIVDGGGGVSVAPSVAAALELPRLVGLRTGLDGSTTRLVLDLQDVKASALASSRSDARLAPDRPVEIPLPGVLVPRGALLDTDGLSVVAIPAGDDDVARIRVAGPPAELASFPLSDPPRVVLDLVPAGPVATPDRDGADRAGVAGATEDGSDTRAELAPGVVYLRRTAEALHGPTIVHVVELEPGAVELRVVGRSGEGRTVAGWADGAVAAINAGYFDPDTFAAIGLRRIGGTLLSWPTRGRAVVGFGATGTVVAKPSVRATVRVDGRTVVDVTLADGEPLSWSASEGARVGTPRHGVLVVGADGRAIRNVVGPQRVPASGSALAYDPDLRPLALVDPGQRVDVGATLAPGGLNRSPWAVEAGPMLVQDGRAAFAPELEGFARGQRILDEPTQQAALGVRADGTVLFVVAERMVAEDLVPLFLSLRADAALRLDSGSSATLVADGRAVNRLLSRRVESAIVAVTNASASIDR